MTRLLEKLSLTEEEIYNILVSTQDFIDGDFYSPGDIHYQTGLSMEKSEEIANNFRLLRKANL
jgi:hypothetical protein